MRYFIWRLAFSFLFVGSGQMLFAQVLGCTNPQAVNFQPRAKQNNGSCTYNPTAYKPFKSFILPKEVNETSGLIFWRNSLWTHNDSGGLPMLYRIDTVDGTVEQRIRVKNATNTDWEELAADSLYIYVGDFGNNSGHRHDLVIYKIRKSDIPTTGDDAVSSEKIFFQYPDYPVYIAKRSKNNYDCEAMIAVGDSLYLFSKDWQDSRTRVYRLPKTPGNYVADLVDSFNTAGLVTAADYNRSKHKVVLLGYTRGNWAPFMWLLWDFKGHAFFSGNKRRIDMPAVTAPQTEGVTFTKGDDGFISSEGRNPFFKPTAYHFDISPFTCANRPASVQHPITFTFTLHPNPVSKRTVSIYLVNLPEKEYSLKLYDSSGKQIIPLHYDTFSKRGKIIIKLRISKLKTGTYFVRIQSGKYTVEHKFIRE